MTVENYSPRAFCVPENFSLPEELELTEAEILVVNSVNSRNAYNGLIDYSNATIHSKRFAGREYNPEIPHMQLENAFVEAIVNPDKIKAVQGLARLMITNFGEFSDALGQKIYSKPVQDHIASGGTLVIPTSHVSYESEPITAAALTEQRIARGEDLEDVVSSQFTVAGRLIGTFALGDLMVVEDLLLPNANLLQTFPATKSGDVAEKTTKRAANKLYKRAQLMALVSPERITIANLNGKQHAFENGEYVMHAVHRSTIELFKDLPQSCGASVMALPVFLRSEALDTLHKDSVDFEIGELMPLDDVHEIYRVIADLGTKALNTSSREDRVGRKVVYDSARRV